MNIAIIGTGNIGSALAKKWQGKGHRIFLGVRDINNFKGMALLEIPNISAHGIEEAVRHSEVILIATPAMSAIEVTKQFGNTSDKVIIDTMNIVNGRGPEGYNSTANAILDNTESKDLVKCFNITGFNNIQNPSYGDHDLDMFMCGDSIKAKEIVQGLVEDAGFKTCYDIGGNDKFELLESFAFFWINLAMMQGHGREIGFKLLKR